MDTGPLVALLYDSDKNHERCREFIRSLREPMATVWPALTEAMHLLRFSAEAQQKLWQIVERGALSILPLDLEDVPRMRQLMARYKDLPMDLADAALVRVAERDKIHRIFTLDRRDFRVYRPEGVGTFTIVPDD